MLQPFPIGIRDADRLRQGCLLLGDQESPRNRHLKSQAMRTAGLPSQGKIRPRVGPLTPMPGARPEMTAVPDHKVPVPAIDGITESFEKLKASMKNSGQR